MHQLTLTGFLGKDAQIRDAQGAKAIGFSVAVNETYKKGGEKVEQTTWYDCTIWRKEGQTGIADYLKEGQQVMVQGRPKPGGYKAGNGDWVPTIEVRVNSIELLGKRGETKAPDHANDEAKARLRDAGAFITDDDDNDLPF